MYLTAIKYGSVAAAGAFAMWLWHSSVVSGMETTAANERASHAVELQLAQTTAQKEVARIEQYHYDKMQRAIADLPKPDRVFVKAKCPSVPAANLSGVDTGERAELDADGRQLVRELRVGILRVEEKLGACQALLIEAQQGR